MFPDRKTALQELAKAEELNPGPWGQHSRNVAHAAELIAGRCDKMDSDKAFVCGLLHDIGRCQAHHRRIRLRRRAGMGRGRKDLSDAFLPRQGY